MAVADSEPNSQKYVGLTMLTEQDFTVEREQMVRDQLIGRNIADPRVLDAMRRVPRHVFVPENFRFAAYRDRPLPIGHEQTISQPYIVAYMIELLQLSGHEIVLEIGTGSGYQTALLAELCAYVHSIELNFELADQAGRRLAELGYNNVEILPGDGSQGLPDQAPFDAIVVSAAVPSIPGPLRAQMRDNGRMVLPVGSLDMQYLERVWRTGETWHIERLTPVVFVPLIGRHGFTRR
jgi:protein-L-isoaspartate(D-aspartate) O-methyltransferase